MEHQAERNEVFIWSTAWSRSETELNCTCNYSSDICIKHLNLRTELSTETKKGREQNFGQLISTDTLLENGPSAGIQRPPVQCTVLATAHSSWMTTAHLDGNNSLPWQPSQKARLGQGSQESRNDLCKKKQKTKKNNRTIALGYSKR